MIKSIAVSGLNGRMDFNLSFHPDINIVTGKNGSGKTTLLKLLWYMMSGNLDRIAPEINFKTAEIETDSFVLSIKRKDTTPSRKGRRREEMEWNFKSTKGDQPITESFSSPVADSSGSYPPTGRLSRVVADLGSSVFFPTFRRIEGGFSMGGTPENPTASYAMYYHGDASAIGSVFARLSDVLSVRQHQFVASISTNDIVSMLTKQYADISERINQDSTRRSRAITELIEKYRQAKASPTRESEKLDVATKILEDIQTLVTEHKERQELLLKSFTALNELISKIFQHKGIRVTSHLTLGEASQAISSDVLSAGEKQMLSFLTYNAFAKKSTIFIDEPEISLHVDWQRTLFPILLSQGTQNQFVVATHSPFIYSKYEDKELILDPDRGGA